MSLGIFWYFFYWWTPGLSPSVKTHGFPYILPWSNGLFKSIAFSSCSLLKWPYSHSCFFFCPINDPSFPEKFSPWFFSLKTWGFWRRCARIPRSYPSVWTCAGPNWSAEDDVGGDDDFLKLLLIVYTIDGWLLKRLVVGHFYVNSW